MIIRSNHGITINHDPIFLKKKVDICIETFFSTLAKQHQNCSSSLQIFLQVVNFRFREFLSWTSNHKHSSLKKRLQSNSRCIFSVVLNLPRALQFTLKNNFQLGLSFHYQVVVSDNLRISH